MARQPDLSDKDVVALKEMIAWVKRSKDTAELIERAKGMKAFVELHPRIRAAAEAYRPKSA